MKRVFIVNAMNVALGVLFCFGAPSLFAQDTWKQWERDATPLHRASQALTGVIVHDIFPPTVASRIYVYAGVAGYEVLVQNSNEYSSLAGQLNMLLDAPRATSPVSYSIAAVAAFTETAKKLVFSEQALEDSVRNIYAWYAAKGYPPALIDSSILFGKRVSVFVLAWSAKDKYKETRAMKRYSLKKTPGTWIPTPPGYMAAVDPHWSKIRAMALDSASQFKPAPPPVFSTDKASEFYKQALEVYEIGKNPTEEQRAIASFWDCNPFFLNTQGHLNFATKKLSPGGHWISIAGIAARKSGADIMRSAAAYTLTALALFDGFISCWDEKYRSQLVRPESYINASIDEIWRPLLQTPPFPEYTSGHSVISTASAVALTAIFGENFAFDDSTETEYGLPIRKFTSFRAAAQEAAISRMYGGIHYRAAIENGQVQGKRVGEHLLAKVHFLNALPNGTPPKSTQPKSGRTN